MRYFFLLLLFLTKTSCQKKETPYTLSDEKMINILADIHISESATQHLALSLRDSMAKVYLNQILEIHDVPLTIFEPQYQRLKKDPKKLQDIYKKILERLDELKKLE